MSATNSSAGATALAPLPWQRTAWRRWQAAQRGPRLTHAWLVYGAAGIGRGHFVAALTAAALCDAADAEGMACGHCPSCKMLIAGGHPDAHLLSPDGHTGLAATAALYREDGLVHWEPARDSKRRDIAVEAVRSLIERLYLASHRGGVRIAVIAPVEALNEASANALLKLIEEPPPACRVFLLAEHLTALKPTLLSRCQRLAVPRPDDEAAAAWLAECAADSDASLRAQALRLAPGAPLRAARLLADGVVERSRIWRETLEALASGRSDPLRAAAAIGKDDFGEFCAWLLMQLQEGLRAVLAQAGQPELGVLTALDATALDRLIGQTLDAARDAERNVNAQLLLESLLIDWHRLVRRRELT